MTSLYRNKNDRENIGIIVENRLINGQEIYLVCLIIKLNRIDFWSSVLVLVGH